MMVVTISTLSEVVERFEIVNRGHPDCIGGFPRDDDLRQYRWRQEGGRDGVVQHRRGEGAVPLVQKVLEDFERLEARSADIPISD